MKHIITKIIFLITIFTNCYSHPHTFIEVEPTIKIKDKNIEKLHIKWILDEMTSTMLIMEFDNDGNGKLDKNENSYIFENYFLSLENYEFYMKIVSNRKKVGIKPRNFKASIEKNRLIYAFDILEKIQMKNLKIDFYDEDLFVGMIIKKDFITLNGIKKEQTNQIKKRIFGVK